MNKQSTVKLTANAVNTPPNDNEDRQTVPEIKTNTEKTDGVDISSAPSGNKDHYDDCRIYISNIPFSFRSRDLVVMFSQFGKVSNPEVVMNERGSKGFGFVTLDSKEASEAARAALHGTVWNGRVIEVKKATANPARRNFAATRSQQRCGPRQSVVLPQRNKDFFSSTQLTQLPQLQQHSFTNANLAEQLNPLLIAQNHLNLQSIINPRASGDVPYSTLFASGQLHSQFQQQAVLANGIPVSPLGISSIPLQLLCTTSSTPLGTSLSKQPLTTALIPISTAGLGYASIPNVNQAGIFIQSLFPCQLAYDVSSNTNKVILNKKPPASQISTFTYAGYLDVLGSLATGNGIAPSSQKSNMTYGTPTHTLRSLDQSCVIDTSLNGELLKEGQFGPIGSAIRARNVSQSSSNSDIPSQSSISRDLYTSGYHSDNESLYTIPIYHHFEPLTDRTGRKRPSVMDEQHMSYKLAKSG